MVDRVIIQRPTFLRHLNCIQIANLYREVKINFKIKASFTPIKTSISHVKMIFNRHTPVTQTSHFTSQDKISKIENIKEKELAQERKRLAQIELKFAQQENTVFNQTQKMTKMEAELNKNKTIQQQLTNL